MYDETEREDSFFLYRNGQFVRQKGHYIYYEKNPEMLNYMEKEANRHVHIVEQEDDRVVRNIRGIMEEKEKNKNRQQQRESHIGYSLGAMIAMIAILVGVAALRNQNTLNQVKDKVNALQELALGELLLLAIRLRQRLQPLCLPRRRRGGFRQPVSHRRLWRRRLRRQWGARAIAFFAS